MSFVLVWAGIVATCVLCVLFPVVVGVVLLGLLFLGITGGLAWGLTHLGDG